MSMFKSIVMVYINRRVLAVCLISEVTLAGLISKFRFSDAKEHMDIEWEMSFVLQPSVGGARKLPLLVTKV